ncbi:MAG: hypothetical protein PHS44_00455 [Candidatus Dojkabacteria bacterium]|jgi:Tfp pilus assembly protein PilX|nr:hypothetical protein [Candidatus Dojkabacteria bacterium]
MNKVRYLNKQNGAALLVSLLVISALALVLAIAVNLSAVDEVLRSSQGRSSLRSRTIADSCLEEAMLRLKRNSSYMGETLNFEYGTCNVTILEAGTIRTVNIYASEETSVTELSVEVELSGTVPIINSWKKGG